MRKVLLILLAAGLLLAGGCTSPPPVAAPTATRPSPTVVFTPTASITPLPSPTSSPTITPTPEWLFQPAGAVVCPILLYHRIADPPDPDSSAARYYVAPADFEMQMQTLHDWGYTAIPLSLLVKAVTEGAALPPRPVVITFDDGDASVHANAFPVMQRYGYTGVVYLVASYLGVDGYMGIPEVQALTDAGWEAGSHSLHHVDLVANPDLLRSEGYDSRLRLQMDLGVPVDSFAYPFGAASSFVIDHVDGYGYQSAVGLGTLYTHQPAALFYLSRIEVRNGTSAQDLAARLPWSGLPGAASGTPAP